MKFCWSYCWLLDDWSAFVSRKLRMSLFCRDLGLWQPSHLFFVGSSIEPSFISRWSSCYFLSGFRKLYEFFIFLSPSSFYFFSSSGSSNSAPSSPLFLWVNICWIFVVFISEFVYFCVLLFEWYFLLYLASFCSIKVWVWSVLCNISAHKSLSYCIKFML